MTLIIDASVTVAWFFIDEQTPVTVDILRRVGADGATVPSLWRLEVANGFRTAVRRKRCSDSYAAQSLDRLKKLSIAIDLETDEHAWGATRDLSAKHGLTIYDAAYLELAIRKQAVLATRDGDLALAASRAGIDTRCE